MHVRPYTPIHTMYVLKFILQFHMHLQDKLGGMPYVFILKFIFAFFFFVACNSFG